MFSILFCGRFVTASLKTQDCWVPSLRQRPEHTPLHGADRLQGSDCHFAIVLTSPLPHNPRWNLLGHCHKLNSAASLRPIGRWVGVRAHLVSRSPRFCGAWLPKSANPTRLRRGQGLQGPPHCTRPLHTQQATPGPARTPSHLPIRLRLVDK